MVVVIAVLVMLMTAGVIFFSGTGSQSRKAGTDMLTAMIEQARTKAITSRSFVVLAVAEPGDLPPVMNAAGSVFSRSGQLAGKLLTAPLKKRSCSTVGRS